MKPSRLILPEPRAHGGIILVLRQGYINTALTTPCWYMRKRHHACHHTNMEQIWQIHQ